jgi:hypothetical protein
LLLLVERETGLKSYIIGQRDNKVCKLLIPIPKKHPDADTYLETNQEDVTIPTRFSMEVLEKRASELGLKIKACETSTSTDVMIYGKEILYRGVYTTQGIKRISRTLPDTNETFPYLQTRVTTLQTPGCSCAQKTLDTVAPYFISSVEALIATVDASDSLHRKKLIFSAEHTRATSWNFKHFMIYLN